MKVPLRSGPKACSLCSHSVIVVPHPGQGNKVHPEELRCFLTRCPPRHHLGRGLGAGHVRVGHGLQRHSPLCRMSRRKGAAKMLRSLCSALLLWGLLGAHAQQQEVISPGTSDRIAAQVPTGVGVRGRGRVGQGWGGAQGDGAGALGGGPGRLRET